MDRFRFPEMRLNVVLCGAEAQRDWVGHRGFDLAIHILYDDCSVLPDPSQMVPEILRPQEVPSLRALDAVLQPMLDDYGDEVYVHDARWPSVIDAALKALEALEAPELRSR